MNNCVEKWPTEENFDMVFIKKPVVDENGTHKIGYKPVFAKKITELRKGVESFKSEGLRCFAQHFSLRFTCSICKVPFLFKALRKFCKPEVEVKWTIEKTKCKCFEIDSAKELGNGLDNVQIFVDLQENEVILTPRSSAQETVVNNLRNSCTTPTSSTIRMPRQLVTPTTSLVKTPKQTSAARWPKASITLNECDGPFTPSANSRVQKQLDGLIECIVNTGAGERKVLEGI